jgi:hypothetical protein
MTEIKKLTEEFRRNVRNMATEAVERGRKGERTDTAKVRIARAVLDKELRGVQARIERSLAPFTTTEPAPQPERHEAPSPELGNQP